MIFKFPRRQFLLYFNYLYTSNINNIINQILVRNIYLLQYCTDLSLGTSRFHITTYNTKPAEVNEGGRVSFDTVIILYIIQPKYYQVLP